MTNLQNWHFFLGNSPKREKGETVIPCPQGIDQLLKEETIFQEYPYVLTNSEFSPLYQVLVSAYEKAGDLPVLNEHIYPLIKICLELIEKESDLVDFPITISNALKRLSKETNLSGEQKSALEAEIDSVLPHLPGDGQIFGLNENSLINSYLKTADLSTNSKRASFTQKIQQTISGLEGLLFIDSDIKDEAKEATKYGAFGKMMISSNDTAKPKAGAVKLSKDRKTRIAECLNVLKEYIDSISHEEVTIISTESVTSKSTGLKLKCVQNADPIGKAISVFEEKAEGVNKVLQSYRTAKLEIKSSYSTELHDPIIQQLTWESLEDDEKALLPLILVNTSEKETREQNFASFSQLLISRYPIHLLVTEEVSQTFSCLPQQSRQNIAHIAVSYRDSFVASSSTSRPQHYLQVMKSLFEQSRASLLLVSIPEWGSPIDPWLQSELALSTRHTALFEYNPGKGYSWAKCFNVDHNPQAESAWVSKETDNDSFTYADLALLFPKYQDQFLNLPKSEWDDDQIELTEYLQAAKEEYVQKIPYILTTDKEGESYRSLLSQKLTQICFDHWQYWHNLQELAGINNEFVIQAVESTKSEIIEETTAKRNELEQAHEQALVDATQVSGENIIASSLWALIDGDPSSFKPSTTPTRPAIAAPINKTTDDTTPMIEESTEPKTEEAESDASEEAYIESVLCTSCNDCIDKNSLLFKYNEDNQAYIADINAGTFAELVKAASGCPSACIHPGKPRAGDKSATPALIALAEKL